MPTNTRVHPLRPAMIMTGTLALMVAASASAADRSRTREETFAAMQRASKSQEVDAPADKAAKRKPRKAKRASGRVPLGRFWKGPKVSVVKSGDVATSGAVKAIVQEVRQQADFAVFLAGGASKMSAEDQSTLLKLFGALKAMADDGEKFVVGDGGTSEGIMQAAGKARRKASKKFPLVGISPAPNVLPGGATEEARSVSKYQPQIDHTDLVAIEPPASWLEEQKGYGWEPSWGFWGAETGPMYEIFARIAEGKPSVAVIANGGGITYNEVKANIKQGRKIVAICGSGRVTDSICHELWGTDASKAEKLDKVQKVPEGKTKSLVKENEHLFMRFDIGGGPEGLRAAIQAALTAK